MVTEPGPARRRKPSDRKRFRLGAGPLILRSARLELAVVAIPDELWSELAQATPDRALRLD